MASNIKKAVLWGDSIGKGVIYDENRGRYVLSPFNAVSNIAEKLNVQIVNRCHMGMTTPQGLTMLERDCMKGVNAEVDTAVIEFGGNDCDFDWSAISAAPREEHLPKTPFAQFTQNMRNMIAKVRSFGMEPILVNLPPINADRYFKFISGGERSPENILEWLGTTHQIYRYQERYSLEVDRIAQENGCRLINLRAAFLDLWRPDQYLCADGIHPNVKGQQLIATAALAQL